MVSGRPCVDRFAYENHPACGAPPSRKLVYRKIPPPRKHQ
jgi:hypothetical protein